MLRDPITVGVFIILCVVGLMLWAWWDSYKNPQHYK